MSRRVRGKRTTQSVEYLNSVSEDREIINRDLPKARELRSNKKFSRRDGSEDRHEKGLRDSNRRQTRSLGRLNKDISREKGAVSKDSEDSLFVEQDSSDDSEENSQPNKVADEIIDEAEEAEEDWCPDDDGSSISSEGNDSIPEDEQQLQQEQEQAFKVLISSASAPADKSPTPTNAEPVNQALESQPLGNDETQQENEIIEESPHITPVRSLSRDVSGWPRPRTPAATAKAKPINNLARQLQTTPESSHRKRRRESTDSETELQRNARRRHTLNIAHDTAARNDAVFPASAPRMAMPSSSRPLSTSFFRRPEHNRTSDPVFIRNRTSDAIISGAQPGSSALPAPSALEDLDSLLSVDVAVALFSSDSEEEVNVEHAAVHISPYDDAMKIVDLQRSWTRLMDNCRIVRAMDSDEDQQYRRVEELERRLTGMINDYRRIQRQRSTGRIVAPNEWDRLRQEAKITAQNADKLLKYLQKRARGGLEDNDLQAQINAIQYAKLIYKKLITGLSEVALECLKAYYADEDEWLMPGGFSAVLDILEIAGRIDSTLTALHKCRVLMLSPDPGRQMRIELRNIQKSLAEAETYERSRGR